LIRLAFRFDDPSETSNQAVEAGVIEALRRNQACATLAVIPFSMVDGQKIALSAARAQPLVAAMREGIVEIAQHGYMHQRRNPEPASPTEFAGLPRDEQTTLIQSGHEHLKSLFGRCIKGFVPPWNSYDGETLVALDALGFKYLSAGQKHIPHLLKLKTIPLTAHLNDIPAVLHEARHFRLANPVIVVVVHHYDFTESGSSNPITDFAGFDRMLRMIREDQRVRICTLGELANHLNTDTCQLMRHQHWARYRYIRHLVPKSSFLDAALWKSALSRLIHG
jgi:peptidoglycan/xylan/chitin deacetylase (PgdA/CDA1 family)